MLPLPRLAAAAAALLLLASPLAATLPEGTTWTLEGYRKVTTSAAGARNVEEGTDTAFLALPGEGTFTLALDSEPEGGYAGTFADKGRTTRFTIDPASQDAFLANLLRAIDSTGVTVVEYDPPAWTVRARPLPKRAGEGIRLTMSMRWKVLTEFRGQTMRIGVRLVGDYRGPPDA